MSQGMSFTRAKARAQENFWKKYAIKNPCGSAMSQSTTIGCEKEPQMANMHQTPSDASGVEIAKAK